MIARGLVLVVAVLAAAWFALGVRQSTDTSEASALITGPSPLSAGQANRARSLLSSASTLNPDKTVAILRGQLAIDQHQNADAVQTLEAVTRDEPDNLSAWIQLAYAAGRAGNRGELTQAGRRISYLFPKLQH
jgi:predicted Zn-dependent protease